MVCLLSAATCSVIAVHQTISFFFTLGIRQRFKRGRAGSDPAIQSGQERVMEHCGNGETTRLVDGTSVTEKTTDLLEVAQRPLDTSSPLAK